MQVPPAGGAAGPAPLPPTWTRMRWPVVGDEPATESRPAPATPGGGASPRGAGAVDDAGRAGLKGQRIDIRG